MVGSKVVEEQPIRAAALLLAGHRQIKIRPRTTGHPRAWSARFNNRQLVRSRPLRACSLQQPQSLLRTLALAALPAISRCARTTAGLIATPVWLATFDDLIGVDRLGGVADGPLIGRKL